MNHRRRILAVRFSLGVGQIGPHETETRAVVSLVLRPTDELVCVARPASPEWPAGVIVQGAVGTSAGVAALVLDFTNTWGESKMLLEHAFTAYVYRR